jgi:type III pantothenate kinase
MANLVVDIGNTFTKIGVFEHDELLAANQYQSLDTAVITDFLNNHNISRAIISSVKPGVENWQSVLSEKTPVIWFNAEMTGGVNNRYQTQATLGPDRLAAVIAANHLYPGMNSLVIDAGTCITYDWVDANGNYFGGSISPGLKMRFKAVNYYTAALPLVNADETFAETYGNDTTSSIRSGIQNGIKYELTGFIESYKSNIKDLNIILTGGDSIFFDTLLKNSIFAPCIKIDPHLVLKGLNAAIPHNND